MTTPDPYPSALPPPWTRAGHEDPAGWFVHMASERPVAYDEQAQVWHFTGHDVVRDFLRQCDDWSTAKRLDNVAPESRLIRLLTSDPPLHAELRNNFSRAYRPRRIASLEPAIRERCRAVLDRCLEMGTFDMTSEFAAPLTLTMIAELIGIPPEYRSRLTSAQPTYNTDKPVVSPLGPLAAPGEVAMPPLSMGGGNAAANRSANQFLTELIDERRVDPHDDLVSDLAKIPHDQLEGHLDVGALLSEQFGAGQSTTTHLLGSLTYYLTEHPDQLELLRRQPDLIPSAIEETLRICGPLQARPRVATRTMEFAGVEVPEGAVGLAWIQAANLDPSVFDDPTTFDVRRSPNPHLAFGFGEHFCLGASLARMEVRVALEEILAATTSVVRVDTGPPEWVEDSVLRGPASMRIEVSPAA